MARNRTIQVSALNVALHRHSESRYIELLQFVKQRRIRAKYHGDRHAMLGFLDMQSEVGEAPIVMRGQILSFVEIDPNDAWLNMSTGKQAEESDLNGMSVPEHLKPGMRIYDFVFFPKKHRLMFESRTADGNSLGPLNAKRIFEILFKHPDALAEFGPTEVTVEPKVDAVDRILEICRLQHLEMTFTRPNPDDNEDDAEEIRRRMDEQNAERLDQNLAAPKGEGLTPDDQTKRFARIAASNGYVNGKGKDEHDNPVNESTKSHPLKERIEFDPNTQTSFSALLGKAKEILQNIGR